MSIVLKLRRIGSPTEFLDARYRVPSYRQHALPVRERDLLANKYRHERDETPANHLVEQ